MEWRAEHFPTWTTRDRSVPFSTLLAPELATASFKTRLVHKATCSPVRQMLSWAFYIRGIVALSPMICRVYPRASSIRRTKAHSTESMTTAAMMTTVDSAILTGTIQGQATLAPVPRKIRQATRSSPTTAISSLASRRAHPFGLMCRISIWSHSVAFHCRLAKRCAEMNDGLVFAILATHNVRCDASLKVKSNFDQFFEHSRPGSAKKKTALMLSPTMLVCSHIPMTWPL